MQYGGGILLTVTLLAGAIVGVRYGQGSLGMVVGLVVGLIGVVVVAWVDDRRRR